MPIVFMFDIFECYRQIIQLSFEIIASYNVSTLINYI